MRSPTYIILKNTLTQGRKDTETQSEVIQREWHAGLSFQFFSVSRICFLVMICGCSLLAQKLAIVAPDQSVQTQKYASQLSNSLSSNLSVLDNDMSLAAFRSVKSENAFNLTTTRANLAAEVIGCDYFLLVRSGTLRRTSFAKPEFYESFVTVFLVNGRSGRLVHWDLTSHEADSPAESERLLFASSGSVAADIAGQLEKATSVGTAPIAKLPEADSSDAKDFRPPMPYKRIKPEYPRKAYLYDIRATVDAVVDVDQNGEITAVKIERWAGFGLDESVIETVRKMNWRPAMRTGKTLPMSVLLRYNFTKVAKD